MYRSYLFLFLCIPCYSLLFSANENIESQLGISGFHSSTSSRTLYFYDKCNNNVKYIPIYVRFLCNYTIKQTTQPWMKTLSLFSYFFSSSNLNTFPRNYLSTLSHPSRHLKYSKDCTNWEKLCKICGNIIKAFDIAIFVHQSDLL